MDVGVGDVVVVQLRGFGAWLIRVGAWLKGKPTHSNHVAIVVSDSDVVEAWPGGVRRSSIGSYLSMRWTLVNDLEPKTAQQRADIASLAISFLKTPYDWDAIAEDTTNALSIQDPLIRDWKENGPPPKSFVCSSLAAYIYGKVGLQAPYGGRFVTPADWAELIQVSNW